MAILNLLVAVSTGLPLKLLLQLGQVVCSVLLLGDLTEFNNVQLGVVAALGYGSSRRCRAQRL